MKLSMMTYTMSRSADFDLAAMLKLTRELDMDGIDVCFAEKLGKPVGELRSMLDDYGIAVVCSTFANNINSPGMTEQKWTDNLEAGLEDAAALGAPLVLMPTPEDAGAARSENRKKWIGVLGKGAGIAEKWGIGVSIENFPGENSPFVTSDDLLEAVKEVPGLKITFDSGNAATGEEPSRCFRRIAGHVAHAHFKDWDVAEQGAEGYRKMLDGRYYKPALVGEGCVDHRACVDEMKKSGYAGCVNIEYEGNKYNPGEAVRRAVSYLRKIA